MAENLKVTHYRDGTSIPYVANDWQGDVDWIKLTTGDLEFVWNLDHGIWMLTREAALLGQPPRNNLKGPPDYTIRRKRSITMENDSDSMNSVKISITSSKTMNLLSG